MSFVNRFIGDLGPNHVQIKSKSVKNSSKDLQTAENFFFYSIYNAIMYNFSETIDFVEHDFVPIRSRLK